MLGVPSRSNELEIRGFYRYPHFLEKCPIEKGEAAWVRVLQGMRASG